MINCKLAEFHLSSSLINGFITASSVHTMLVINYCGRSNQKGSIPHEHTGLPLQKHVGAFLQAWPLTCMFPGDHPSSTLSFKVVSKLALSPLAVMWDPGTDVYVEPSWCGTVTGWNILNKHVFENQRPGSGLFRATAVHFSCWPAPEGQIGTLCSCDSMFMSFKQASALSRKVREASARSAAQVFQKLAVVEAEGEPGEPFLHFQASSIITSSTCTLLGCVLESCVCVFFPPVWHL